jgi:EMC6-arch
MPLKGHHTGVSMEIKTPTKEERVASHIKGIKMTVMPAIMGFIAGALSSPYFLPQADVSFSFLILALAIYAQKYTFPLIGIKSKDFAFKDWFYLSFISFTFWYVTWTIIINGPAITPLF